MGRCIRTVPRDRRPSRTATDRWSQRCVPCWTAIATMSRLRGHERRGPLLVLTYRKIEAVVVLE